MKEWASTTSWQSQRSPPQSSADHSPPTSHHSHTGPSCGLQAARLAKRWQVSRKAPARQGRHLQGGTPGFLRDSSAAEKNSILARVQGCLQRAATPLAADKDGAEASSPAPASHSPMRPYHVFAVSGVVEGYHHAFGSATIPRWTRELLFPPTSTTWWTRSCPATSVPRRASSPGRLPPACSAHFSRTTEQSDGIGMSPLHTSRVASIQSRRRRNPSRIRDLAVGNGVPNRVATSGYDRLPKYDISIHAR